MGLVLICLCTAGCSLVKREAHYARFTKLPQELENGPMRLAQRSVQVQIMGQENVSTFETIEASGYFIIHELDLATFIRRQRLLQQILADPEAKRLIVGKNLHKLEQKPRRVDTKNEVKNE